MLLTQAPLDHRRTGGAAAGGRAVLRLVLVAVPAGQPAAAGGVSDRPAAGPAGLSAAGRRRVHPAGRAWRRAGAAPVAVAPRGFVWIWIVFCGVAAAASLVIWLLVMLLTFRLLSPYPAMFTAS